MVRTSARNARTQLFRRLTKTNLEFFFELVPQGELTPKLYKLQVGDELLMRKIPKGRFTLDTKSGRTNHLLVATVTGVAPFVSYVRSLYKDWKEGKFAGDHKLFLLEGASRSWELGYCEELQKFALEVPWLKYVPTISRPWDDLHGSAKPDALTTCCANMPICGGSLPPILSRTYAGIPT